MWWTRIYGAQEAAAYYFKKRPSQLTAEESIFLASIIPKSHDELIAQKGEYYQLYTGAVELE